MNKTPKYVTPGLSPILKKYKTVSLEVTDQLLQIFAKDIPFENTVRKSIVKNKNVCIHPYNLTLIYSTNEMENKIVQELNESYLTYEYKDWYKKYHTEIGEDKLFYNQFIANVNDFLKTSFIDCTKRFIIFPISMFFYIFIDGKVKDVNGHAGFCIYDSFQEKVFFFDPSEYEYERIIDQVENNFLQTASRRKIIAYKILKSLKVSNPFLKIKSVEIVDVIAPQAITQDYNCLFWSLLLCDIIVKNLKADEEFKPKLAIRSLLKKYNTKEKLERVIRRYIGYVYETAKDIPNSFYTDVLKNTYLEK